jgi:hypothetical protein
MTIEQQQHALELLREAVHKSLDPDFDIRVSRLMADIQNLPPGKPLTIDEEFYGNWIGGT